MVENKAGASGMPAASGVARATADGYTVLITTNTTHAANEPLYKKLPYDPVKDFAPLTGLGKGGQVLVTAVKSASTQAFFESSGSVAWTTPPAELARFQAAETGKWGKVIKAAGITAE